MGAVIDEAPTTWLPALAVGGGIVSVAAGAEHSLAATSAGEVFSWGSAANGRLGRRHRRCCTLPKQSRDRVHARRFCLVTLSYVSASQSDNAGGGDVWQRVAEPRPCKHSGWRLWQRHEPTPRLLRSLAGTRIASVAAGLMHSGVLAPLAAAATAALCCRASRRG